MLQKYTDQNENPNKFLNVSKDLQFFFMQFQRDQMRLHVQNSPYIIVIKMITLLKLLIILLNDNIIKISSM